MHAGWPCSNEDSIVSVAVILVAQVPEGDTTRVYLATSAKPAQDPMGYDCHACAPAIGAAVFVWRDDHWGLESENPAVGFYGGWGEPSNVNLVQVGPQKHGLLLSSDDEGQGFSSSWKSLLIPLGKTVSEVWTIEDENDNLGAVDPTDKLNPEMPYRASAAFRFDVFDEKHLADTGYYDIEVISRGKDKEDYGHPFKSENWTEIYRFGGIKYQLLQRKSFVEVTKAKGARRGRHEHANSRFTSSAPGSAP